MRTINRVFWGMVVGTKLLAFGAICLGQVVVPNEQTILDALDEPERKYVIRCVEEETKAAEKRQAAAPLPYGTRSDLIRTPTGEFVRMYGKDLFKVNQVIDEGNVLLSGGIDLWLEGINSASLTDGSSVALKGILWARGTKTYTAVSGASRTIANFVKVDEAKAQRAIDRILELRSYRTWKSKNGQYNLEDARFVSFAKGEVTLLKKGSDKEIVVKAASLSDECQKAIRDHLKVAAERKKFRNS